MATLAEELEGQKLTGATFREMLQRETQRLDGRRKVEVGGGYGVEGLGVVGKEGKEDNAADNEKTEKKLKKKKKRRGDDESSEEQLQAEVE
jgi:hypothetical protein